MRLGDRYSGSRLIAANAFVGLLWGVGGLGGPLLAGLAINARGPQGLMQFIALAALACAALLVLRRAAPPA